jgi:hypothetical protein
MKQTAIEFLINKIIKLTGVNINMDEPIIEQSKLIFEEQIRDAFNEGMNNSVDYFIPSLNDNNNDESKVYYKKTFKK